MSPSHTRGSEPLGTGADVRVAHAILALVVVTGLCAGLMSAGVIHTGPRAWLATEGNAPRMEHRTANRMMAAVLAATRDLVGGSPAPCRTTGDGVAEYGERPSLGIPAANNRVSLLPGHDLELAIDLPPPAC